MYHIGNEPPVNVRVLSLSYNVVDLKWMLIKCRFLPGTFVTGLECRICDMGISCFTLREREIRQWRNWRSGLERMIYNHVRPGMTLLLGSIISRPRNVRNVHIGNDTV